MKEYAVVYEWAETNYSAYIPDLPGCVATGKTLDETKQRMQKALAMHIEAMRRDSDVVPEPATLVGQLAVAA